MARTPLKKLKKVEDVVQIPIALIKPWKDQPRKVFHEDTIEDLSGSLLTHGQTEPAIVIALKGDSTHKFLLISGERRYRACLKGGVDTLDCIIRAYEDPEDVLFEAGAGNVGREDLNDLDSAALFLAQLKSKRVRKLKKGRIEYVAKINAKSAQWVRDRLLLLDLDPEVQRLLVPTQKGRRPQLPVRTAVALAKNVSDKAEQRRVAKTILGDGDSPRLPGWRSKKVIEEARDVPVTGRRARLKPSDIEQMITSKLVGMTDIGDSLFAAVSDEEISTCLASLTVTQRRALLERAEATNDILQRITALISGALPAKSRKAKAGENGAAVDAN